MLIMRSRLFIASLWTLGLLFGMLGAVVLLLLWQLGQINISLVFGITVVLNVLIWLVSPKLTDLMQRWFYRTTFYKADQFKAEFPAYYEFLEDLSQKNKTKFPIKIGIIDDDNPTAFSYGSGRWNSRIVFTKGLQTYLEKDEIEAVLGHEFGHIVHRDFIVMSVASVIIQLLYEIYYIFAGSKGGNRKANKLAAIGWLAYVFYWLGSYVVLFLNRLREYYADEFSAESMQESAALENALVKIAYGIMAKEDTSSGARLLESTKTMGIMSLKNAKNTALAVHVTNMVPDKVAKVMVFDVVSPWAKLAQLSSTHPLTGKRLLRLESIAAKLGKKQRYDIAAAKQAMAVQKFKLWRLFLTDLVIGYLQFIALVAGALVAVYSIKHPLEPRLVAVTVLPCLLVLFVGRVFYIYPPTKKAAKADIYTLMTDVYASPVRGRVALLDGSIIGRGMPGFMFGKDMMIQDKTGLLYLSYQGPIPLFSNLFFALKRFQTWLGKQANVSGWFYRSNTQYMRLSSLAKSDGSLKSYQHFYALLGAVISALLIAFLVSAAVALADPNNSYHKALVGANQASKEPVSISDKCFDFTAPAGSSRDPSQDNTDCTETIRYPAPVSYFDSAFSKVQSALKFDFFSISYSAQPASESFADFSANYKKTIKPSSDTSTIFDGLPAERISYVSQNYSPPSPTITYLVDASSRLKKAPWTNVYVTFSGVAKKDNGDFKSKFDQALSNFKIKQHDLADDVSTAPGRKWFSNSCFKLQVPDEAIITTAGCDTKGQIVDTAKGTTYDFSLTLQPEINGFSSSVISWRRANGLANVADQQTISYSGLASRDITSQVPINGYYTHTVLIDSGGLITNHGTPQYTLFSETLKNGVTHNTIDLTTLKINSYISP